MAILLKTASVRHHVAFEYAGGTGTEFAFEYAGGTGTVFAGILDPEKHCESNGGYNREIYLEMVPKTSDRTQVEAKEIRLSDMPPVTLDDRNMHIKTDDTSEMNIPEDFDNRPSKKAKNSESGVLEPSPMSFMAYKDDLEWSLRVPATGLWSRRRAVTRELIPGHQRAPAAKKAANSGLNYGNQDLGDRLGDLRGGCVISMHCFLTSTTKHVPIVIVFKRLIRAESLPKLMRELECKLS
ncbi:hypothetical protein TRIUR3_35089 [Triticum urartu]|uniref:Uncharacterized protein n=1 Tax=Triticum urartu TaxID=4572 RepID=M8AJA7_TRIUA|nr:hypothetical protein TRIUR3_35089 [Triticum urartu]